MVSSAKMNSLFLALVLLPFSAIAFNTALYSALCPGSRFLHQPTTRKCNCELISPIMNAHYRLQPSMPVERRSFISILYFLTLAPNLPREATAATAPQSAPFLQRVSLTAKDLEEEVDFFTKGLGFRLRQVGVSAPNLAARS